MGDQCRGNCPLECTKHSFSMETSSANLNTNDSGILRLNIFYKDLSYQMITESQAISSIGLFGSLGGITGLLMGLSMLSFIEIIEFIVNILSIVVKRCLLPKKRKVNQQNMVRT